MNKQPTPTRHIFILSLCLTFTLALLTACANTSQPTPPPDNPTSQPTEPTQPTQTIAEPTNQPTEPTEPTPSPTTQPTPPPDPNAPANFTLPPSVAASSSYSVVQGSDEPGFSLPYWAHQPDHIRYSFDQYALPNTFHEPQILIYPMPDFADLNPAAREAYTQLQTILRDQPDLASLEQLPFLPIFNAAQVFHAQEAYLPFVNGQGIRYLTYFSQGIMPVTNQELFYTYQGISNDGRHYLAAILPIASPTLPDDVAFDAETYEAIAADYDNYLQTLISELNQTDPASFTPPLSDLDSLMSSWQVLLPPPTKETNDSGQIILGLTRPVAQAQLAIGGNQTVAGYVAPGSTEPIEISLSFGVNEVSRATAVPDPTTGDWTTELFIPPTVQGLGQITVRTGNQQTSIPVSTYAPYDPNGPSPNEVVLKLFRPIPGASLTIGMPAFYEGQAQNLIDDSLTIALLTNNCTTIVSRQNISLPPGAGQWRGVLFLPSDVVRPDAQACAIAYTGTYGENWREVQLPLSVFAPDDPQAVRLSVGVPWDAVFRAGEVATLFGGAVQSSAPENVVLVTVRTQEAEPRLLAEGLAPVDSFGYWEIDLLLPEEYRGPALLDVSIPNTAEPYVHSSGFMIE
jgi:hypothetical protein